MGGRGKNLEDLIDRRRDIAKMQIHNNVLFLGHPETERKFCLRIISGKIKTEENVRKSERPQSIFLKTDAN